MKYWLLTWNPNRWAWNELNGGFDDIKHGIVHFANNPIRAINTEFRH